MNARALILFAVAGIGIVVVVMLSRSFFSNVEQQASKQVKKPAVQILVTAKELKRGTIIKEEHLIWQNWPETGLNKAYYKTGSVKKSDLKNKVIITALPAGSPLTKTSLVTQGEQGFMAAILAPGMRAVSVTISPVSGVAGFIFPGDRVDVILTHVIQDSQKAKFPVSETVLQNIRVLGIDQRSDAADTKIKAGKTATLEVAPKMAEKITLLSRLGTLSLVLRSLSQENVDNEPMSGAASATFGAEVSKFLPSIDQKKKEGTKVKVVRGSATKEQSFDGANKDKEGDNNQ